MAKKRITGWFVNLEEDELKQVEKAHRILTKVLAETRHDNRDTQILTHVNEKIKWVIEQQYE